MSHRTPIGQRCRPSKIGRNKFKCEKYAATNQREKNKKRKAETRDRQMRRARIQRRGRENYAALVNGMYDEAC